MKSPITTHVLDTAGGKPAKGITVILEKEKNGTWNELAHGVTNEDGRITDWLTPGQKAQTGFYRVTFKTAGFYSNKNPFYSDIPILFHLHHPDEHYHIPLLLSPFGYSTYRGS